MAVLTNAAFLSTYSSIFADNATREISELDMRNFRQDIADSFLNKTDGGTVSGTLIVGSTKYNVSAIRQIVNTGTSVSAEMGRIMIGRSGTGWGVVGENIQATTTNDTYNYATVTAASMIDFTSGHFSFKTAPAGTAGTAITFTERLRINNSTGNVGIGTSSPNAPLQFSNALANRKIVLYDANNNNHQYYGLGVQGSIFRYQTPATTDDHVWYAGTSATTSNELMRLKGTGKLILPVAPVTNDTEDAILVRNATSGEIQARAASTIASSSDGFYTPILTNISNVAATVYEAYWLKVGTKVTVFGQLDIQATTIGVVVLAMSFPISVTSILVHQASGTVASGVEEETGHIKADDINLRAELTLSANGTTNHRIYYHYSYLKT
jgi:hypothetical protein